MSQDKIEELIKELKSLHVREQHILTKLEEAHRAQTQVISGDYLAQNRQLQHAASQ
jgi:hypothetical protein